MDGVIRNTADPIDTLVYQMIRNLKATDNGSTVRMYHYNNEFSEGDNVDYRPSHAFRITVNADKTLSFTTWDQFHIIDGGGRSEEHTSELQSLMRISYAVFCLKKNRNQISTTIM